jgi:glycosyltransferase involved in cell wall biosynthesis
MNIAALTDHVFTPSSRYRIRQYINPLREYGISVKDFQRKYSSQLVSCGDKRIRHSPYLMYKATFQEMFNFFDTSSRVVKSNSFDAVWLSRQLIIGYPSMELIIKKPLIYDIDDAVFLTSYLASKQVEYSSNKADIIFAGNDYLADYLSKYNDSVYVIPTPVDIRLFRPKRDTLLTYECNTITIGWSGTSSSYKYFLSLEGVLIKILTKYKNINLVFVSDRFPHELKKLSQFVQFIKWSAQDDASNIQKFDIGIMPIDDDEWCEGKGAYKMLLYASCGVPVIVSPVGENKRILEHADIGIGPKSVDDWYSAIETLVFDKEARFQLGANGREYVVSNRNLYTWTKEISQLLLRRI